MAPKKPIPASLESAESKKQSLRKAYEDLQSHSSSLASFTLQWKDLEDHFDSIRKSIDERLKELESKENGVSSKPLAPSPEPAKKTECEAHPAMKTFCAKMDAMGLRGYIMDHRKELNSIREEVGIAFQSASDPAKLVLDAMGGFYPANSKGDKDGELAALRRMCILLLEELGKISPKVTQAVKERAKKLAIEWKGKASPGHHDRAMEPLAFLQFVATFGLTAEFDADALLEFAIPISRRKQAVDLLKALNFPDKIPNFIEKLTNDGKHIDAIKFVYAFELVDKFPPIPLLKAYQKHSKKVAQDIRGKGNNSAHSLNESMAKELAAVKAMIKCIEEHKLESEFPKNVLDKRVEQLEKQKADKKRPATGPASASKQQQQQQSGNKRPRPASNNVGSTVPPVSQTHLQPVSSYMDRINPYITSSTPYGHVGNTPSAAPYMSSATGSYGLGTNPLGYGAGRSPPRSFLYSSEAHLGPGLYDRPLGFTGHGMPPSQRPSFYP